MKTKTKIKIIAIVVIVIFTLLVILVTIYRIRLSPQVKIGEIRNYIGRDVIVSGIIKPSPNGFYLDNKVTKFREYEDCTGLWCTERREVRITQPFILEDQTGIVPVEIEFPVSLLVSGAKSDLYLNDSICVFGKIKSNSEIYLSLEISAVSCDKLY